MKDVGTPGKESTTSNHTYIPNNSTTVGTLTLDQFKSRHPNSTATITLEGFQAVMAKIREINQAAKDAKKSRFDRTPGQIEHIKGTHRRRDASLRLEPLDCGCLDPFTPHHREVCMRWER